MPVFPGGLRARVAELRWRLRWEIDARAATLIGITAAGGYLVAVFLEPDWTLRFSRVLAWPIVALVALIAFRLPLSRLFHGQIINRLSIGPATFELQQGAPEPAPLVEGEADELTEKAIYVMSVLTQIYQFQINFLRHLRQAGNDGLTSEAARDWMRAALAQPDAVPQVVEPLLRFLVNRGLITLRADDHYVIAELGETFLDGIEGLWYAPKAF